MSKLLPAVNPKNQNADKLILWLVSSWLVVGIITTGAGFIGWLYMPLSVLLLLPAVMLGAITLKFLQQHYSVWEKSLLGLLLVVLAVHATGLLVPEIGFDAVWYHLPVIDSFVNSHQILYLENFYQSLNPLFTDLIFLLGYQVGGEFGAKVVAYLLMVTLLLVSYVLARQFIKLDYALMTIIIIALFQPIAWQATSFYIDIGKAVWEVGAVLLLVLWVKKPAVNHQRLKLMLLASLIFGASLASKQFSDLLLPAWMFAIWWHSRSGKQLLLSLIAVLVIPSFFYLHTFLATGDLFYLYNFHFSNIAQMGSKASLSEYLISRLVTLPFSIFKLTVVKDYTSPLLLLFGPLLLWKLRSLVKDQGLQLLAWFAVHQWLVWWFLPPLSTRYALSGFILFMILMIWSMEAVIKEQRSFQKPLLLTVFISIAITLAPRLVISAKNVQHLVTRESKSSYIKSKFDGNADQHLSRWHQLDQK
jgi:hypothetical protein